MKRKILQGALALLIACGLWVYVITVDNPNDEMVLYDVPVGMSGETFLHERGLMLSADEIPTITLTLSGNRSYLKKVNKSNIMVVADLSRITNSGKQQLNYDIIFPGDVPDNAITVESRLPDRVAIVTEGRSQEELPVKVVYVNQVKDGFIPDKNSLETDQKFITAVGPTAILDQVDHVQVTVDLENRSENIVKEKLEYVYCDKDGNPVDSETIDVSRLETKVSEVEVSMKIQRLKEVQLVVEVIYGGGATKDNTMILQDIQVIDVTGSEPLLEGLDQLKVGTIDLSQEKEDTVKKFPVVLPDGVNNVTGVTEISVNVEFKDLETKTITTSKIEGVNIPKGMKAEIKVKALEVTLRGPSEQLENLTEEHVTVRINFSNAQLGTESYPASIYVDSQITGVGAVGTYPVLANITAQP